eukprot:gene19939-21892_t
MSASNNASCPDIVSDFGTMVGIENFELLKVLGTGAYGKVFLVRKKGEPDNGKLFAMKVLKKASIVQKAKTTEHTITERSVLAAVRACPFIVKLHYAFQTEAKLHLVMDFVSGGELFTHLYNREHFTEDEARFYIAEVAIALDHLHKLGIIYRDIKLENVLLDSNGHVVLTDFGLSKFFSPYERDGRAYSFCGTIEYMAPEVVKGGSRGHDMSVDWWSLGVLLYELLTGASPFTVEGEKNSQQEISKRIINNLPPMPASLSSSARHVIRRLLDKDSNKRLGGGDRGFNEIKVHPFFQSMDWDLVAKKKLSPPFKPAIDNEMDVSNFAEEFTQMLPIDSPAVVPNQAGRVFRGYSFVAPSVIFGNNTIADDILSPGNAQDKPRDASLAYTSLFDNSSFHKEYALLDEQLGEGSFSICRRCINRRTKVQYAVKIISKRLDHGREISTLKLCQGHPNIVTLHEVHTDDLHTYLVLELLEGGELLDRIKKKKNFTEAEARRLTIKLVSVVHFIQDRGVVHRDLKPENLLFVDDGEDAELKLVDFGFARLKGSQPLQTPCFTLSYAAPEILKNATQEVIDGYDEACDIWSLGVILYTMLSGKVPFHSKTTYGPSAEAIARSIMDGSVSFDGEEWINVSASAKSFILGLLTVDPKRRLTLMEILAHDWLCGRVEVPTTPLMTPDVLDMSGSHVGTALRVALNVYHKAARSGFTLMDVSNAPLAKRRKNKNASNESQKGSPDTLDSSGSSTHAQSWDSNFEPDIGTEAELIKSPDGEVAGKAKEIKREIPPLAVCLSPSCGHHQTIVTTSAAVSREPPPLRPISADSDYYSQDNNSRLSNSGSNFFFKDVKQPIAPPQPLRRISAEARITTNVNSSHTDTFSYLRDCSSSSSHTLSIPGNLPASNESNLAKTKNCCREQFSVEARIPLLQSIVQPTELNNKVCVQYPNKSSNSFCFVQAKKSVASTSIESDTLNNNISNNNNNNANDSKSEVWTVNRMAGNKRKRPNDFGLE